MLADSRRYKPFNSVDWVFEIKNDGYRMLAQFGRGGVRMKTRGGQDCTASFPEVAEKLAAYRGGPHIVDGEVCVLDEWGRSHFDRLRARASRQRWVPGGDAVVFCMFDLLVAGRRNLMPCPLSERKAELRQLFTPKPKTALLVVEAIPEMGMELYAMAVQLKLEGLIAKRCDSIYQPGERSTEWRKLKVPGAVPRERFKRT